MLGPALKGAATPAWAAPRRRETLLAAALIVLAGAAVYANSFSGPLVFDDLGSIADNPTIRQLWPIGPALHPPAGLTVTGRPLVNLSLAVNYAISGTRVWSYHALNLLVHVLAGLALFGIMRRTLAREAGNSTVLALAIALLWTVHPLQTESVSYIVQRAESLMGLLYLLTLYGFIRYAGAPSSFPPSHPGAWAGLTVFCCLLGMATKEVMVSAPLIVLLYDRTFVSGSWALAWRRHHRLYLSLAATWILLAWLVAAAGNRGGSAGFHAAMPWTSYARTQLWAIVHYLRLALAPHPLVFYYGRMLRTGLTIEGGLDAAAVGLLAAGTAIALWRWPRLGFAGAWFFAILAPTSSVIPVATETVAEHRMYLGLIPVVAGVVLAGARWLSRPVAIAGFLAALVVLGGLTLIRNRDYGSDLALWRATVRTGPENPVALNNLGEALRTRGQLADAREQFEHALRLDPAYADAGNNLGVTLAALGRPAEAIAVLARTAAIKPDDAEAQLNWGNVLQEQGAFAAATGHYAAALRLEPDRAATHFNLGKLLLQQGRVPDALAQFSETVRLAPEDPEARDNLGIALAETSRSAEAEAQFAAALRLRPNYVQAHNNLGSLLIAENRLPEAEAQYAEAVRLDPRLPELHYNLGLALQREGRRGEAAGQFEAALQLRPDYPAAREQLARLQAGS